MARGGAVLEGRSPDEEELFNAAQIGFADNLVPRDAEPQPDGPAPVEVPPVDAASQAVNDRIAAFREAFTETKPTPESLRAQLDEAFESGLLKYQTRPKRPGQEHAGTYVKPATPEAQEWYDETVARRTVLMQEERRQQERATRQQEAAAAAREAVDAAVTDANEAATVPEPQFTTTEIAGDELAADEVVVEPDFVADKSEVPAPDQATDITDAEVISDVWNPLEQAVNEPKAILSGPAPTAHDTAPSPSTPAPEQSLGDIKRSHKAHLDALGKRSDRIMSPEAAAAAAEAVKPEIDRLIERQRALDKAARNAESIGLDIRAPKKPAENESKADTARREREELEQGPLGNVAGDVLDMEDTIEDKLDRMQDNHSATLTEALRKATEKPGAWELPPVRAQLSGAELSVANELRATLGIGIVPDVVDGDRRFLMQYTRSELDPDVVMCEKIDRKTLQLVEATLINQPDALVDTNGTTELSPSAKRALRQAARRYKAERPVNDGPLTMVESHWVAHPDGTTTEEKVEVPFRRHTGPVGLDDLVVDQADLMRARGASAEQVSTMEARRKQYVAKRSRSWLSRWFGV